MAKTAWINRNERKRKTVKKYAAIRAELKAKKDYAGLTQLPRDASPTRVVNRCEVTGRRRAFIRRFKVSRARLARADPRRDEVQLVEFVAVSLRETLRPHPDARRAATRLEQ